MSWELIIGFTGVLLSLISISIAWWSAYNSNKYSKKQTDLQRRVVNLEEQREERIEKELGNADLKIDLEKIDTGKYVFRIVNNGPAVVEDLVFKINGKKPHEFDKMLLDLESIKKIEPGGKREKRISNTKGQSSVIDVVAEYIDENGKREKKFRLNF